MCLWVENAVVKGRYGDSMVTGSATLTGGQWHNIIFRHSIEGTVDYLKLRTEKNNYFSSCSKF